MQGDQADAKPIPKKQALDDAISESAAESAAIDLLRMEVLAEKVALVERRRPSLVRDCRKRAVEGAKRRYLDAVDAVEAARTELVELNEARVWAAVYPSDTLSRRSAPGRRKRRWRA
jgi:hypothetical protein